MSARANGYHQQGPATATWRRTYISRDGRLHPMQPPGNAERGSMESGMEIGDWRTKIDSLDEQIVRLLSERAAAAVAIGELKQKSGGPIYEPQRERAVFEQVRAANPGPLSGAQLQDIYERIMDVMRALQRPQA